MRTIANALDAIAADQHYTFAADTYDLANLFRAELRVFRLSDGVNHMVGVASNLALQFREAGKD